MSISINVTIFATILLNYSGNWNSLDRINTFGILRFIFSNERNIHYYSNTSGRISTVTNFSAALYEAFFKEFLSNCTKPLNDYLNILVERLKR